MSQNSVNPTIEKSWKDVLINEFQNDYFVEIKEFLMESKNKWVTIYPSFGNIFNAFNLTPFDDLKVVLLGQDPYHWPNQAHWLSFSVQEGIKQPPSLQNIFKEIESDIGIKMSSLWNLEKWSKQWVFLLNAILTVEKSKPASHQKIWWELFTDAVIKVISDNKEWVVFFLWWNFARSKKALIDTSKHYVFEAPHPSPFSVHKWFFWCKHFSKCNKILVDLGKEPINWQI